MEVTTEVAPSSANEVITFRNNEAVVVRQEVAPTMEELTAVDEEPKLGKGKGKGDGYRPDEDADMSNSAIPGDQNTSGPEIVADTIMGGGSSLEDPSSAAGIPEAEAGQEIVMSTSNIITISSEPVDQALPTQVDVSVQTEEVVEGLSADGLKAKLQSIIGDLGTIALDRDEMNELEDLFMDAKQQLYSAGRRGRAGS